MKRYILAAALAVASAAGVCAQTSYSSTSRLDSLENALSEANAQLKEQNILDRRHDVWRRGRYTNIGWSLNQTSSEILKQTSSVGIGFAKGTAYTWPKDGVAGIVKFGFDVKWFDLDFSLYGKRDIDVVNQSSTNNTGYTGDRWNGTFDSSAQPSGYLNPTVNTYGLNIGAFGIGPAVTIAPLAMLDSPVRSLRATIYFHYQPTFGMVFNHTKYTDSYGYDESEIGFDFGYVSMMDFGFRLNWKNIGLGVEGRWGSGKLKTEGINIYNYASGYGSSINIPINTVDPNADSYTRKFGSTRIFLTFAF